MGYTVTIGNAVVKESTELLPSGCLYRYLYYEIGEQVHPDCPSASDFCIGKGNCVCPGYSFYDEFLRQTGLDAIFPSNEEAKANPRFDVVTIPLDEEALEMMESCLRSADTMKFLQSNRHYALSLDWLIFWTRWAIANCANPSLTRG